MKGLAGKTILVTGADGFIGTHLSVRLALIDDVRLLLLSRKEVRSDQSNVRWLKGELGQVTEHFWENRGISHIDYVFHLAGFTPKASGDANRINRSVDDNIIGTRILLQGLPNIPNKLIFASSLDVYGHALNDEILSESSKVKPASLYGASKLFCEKLVSIWAKDSGCKYAILRYGHIYGPGEEQYGKLIPVVIRNLLANQSPVLHGDGGALRDFLYVGDAVEATLRAAVLDGTIPPVNIVSGKSVTIKEVVQILCNLMRDKNKIKFLDGSKNGPSLQFDNQLMDSLLGSWGKVPLELGLAEEMKYFRGDFDGDR